MGYGLQLDVQEFEKMIQTGLQIKGEKGKQLIEQGLSYYHGDYLSERRFDDWCLEEKERMQVLYLRGEEQLAKHFFDKGHYDRAIGCCEKIFWKKTDAGKKPTG